MNMTTFLARLFLASAIFAGTAHAAAIKEDAEVFLTKDKKIGQLRAGAPVTVVQESGEWIKVHYETTDAAFDGYVRRDQVDLTATGAAPMPDALAAAGAETSNAVPMDAVATNVAVSPTRPPATFPARAAVELGVSSHWQIQSKSGGTLASDLATLLRGVTKPQINLAASRNVVLYKELYFPMPIGDALKTFNQTKVSPEPVNTPGFPADSFKAYSFDAAADKFTRVTLVSDMKNQLVAVQLSDTSQKGPWLYKTNSGKDSLPDACIFYSDELKLFNIIQARAKGSANWRVGAVRESKDGLLRIDTELISGSFPNEDIKSRERIRLLIPQSVADLCAYLLQNRR